MPANKINKYRAALEVLQRGRERMVDELANLVLDQSDDLLESGFLFNEFLENQGTRLHFLSLLLAQLEQSAELLEEHNQVATELPPHFDLNAEDFLESHSEPPELPKRKRRRNSKKLSEQASREGEPGET